MTKVIVITSNEQFWQVRFEKENFSLDCKCEEAAFNCAWQLICFEIGEIYYVQLQTEEGAIQGAWISEEFDSMLAAKISKSESPQA